MIARKKAISDQWALRPHSRRQGCHTFRVHELSLMVFFLWWDASTITDKTRPFPLSDQWKIWG